MTDYSLFIKLNALKNVMVRLGDGLRMAFVVFRELHNNDYDIIEETLYNMLIDLSTFSNKQSLDHFYTYITEYLMYNGEYFSSDCSYTSSKLYYYTTPNESDFEEQKVPLLLFNYFYSTIWKEIVKIAIYDYYNLNIEHPPRNLFISFNDYKKLYPNNNIKDEDLCIKFLDDLDSFLRYNHIIKMKEFNLGKNGLDLYIPLQFKFTHLH